MLFSNKEYQQVSLKLSPFVATNAHLIPTSINDHLQHERQICNLFWSSVNQLCEDLILNIGSKMEPKPFVTALYRFLSKLPILLYSTFAEFSGFSLFDCLSIEKEPLVSH